MIFNLPKTNITFPPLLSPEMFVESMIFRTFPGDVSSLEGVIDFIVYSIADFW